MNAQNDIHQKYKIAVLKNITPQQSVYKKLQGAIDKEAHVPGIIEKEKIIESFSKYSFYCLHYVIDKMFLFLMEDDSLMTAIKNIQNLKTLDDIEFCENYMQQTIFMNGLLSSDAPPDDEIEQLDFWIRVYNTVLDRTVFFEYENLSDEQKNNFIVESKKIIQKHTLTKLIGVLNPTLISEIVKKKGNLTNAKYEYLFLCKIIQSIQSNSCIINETLDKFNIPRHTLDQFILNAARYESEMRSLIPNLNSKRPNQIQYYPKASTMSNDFVTKMNIKDQKFTRLAYNEIILKSLDLDDALEKNQNILSILISNQEAFVDINLHIHSKNTGSKEQLYQELMIFDDLVCNFIIKFHMKQIREEFEKLPRQNVPDHVIRHLKNKCADLQLICVMVESMFIKDNVNFLFLKWETLDNIKQMHEKFMKLISD